MNRSDTIALLDAERAKLVATVERVPPNRRDERPENDAWSVADLLEHLARTERSVVRLFERIASDPAITAPPTSLPTTSPAEARDRSTRREAPERVRPTGTVSCEAALDQLGASRVALFAALQRFDDQTLATTRFPHPVFGNITLAEWFEFVAHHEARHTAQLTEIAAALEAR